MTMTKTKLRHNGFTLVEVVVVIFIISLVMGVAVVMFSRFNEKHSLLSKAEQTVSLLKFCHRYAMFNQTNIEFLLSRNGYTIKKQFKDGYRSWTPVPEATSRFSVIQFEWQPPATKVKQDRIKITFHADGSISAPIDKIPFTIRLLVDQKPTGVAISVSPQGSISVTKQGATIEQ